MKKRILCLAMALCMIAALLPMATLAAETESVSVSITFQSSTSSVEYNATKTLTPGMTAIYGKTDATTGVIAWEGDESDYNIKLECAEDGVPTMTLQNAYINKAKSGASEHNTSVSGTGDLLIKLIGENKIDMQLGFKESLTGYGLVFSNAGDTTFTSVNDGTLTMTHSRRTAINKTKGNLIFKDANVTIEEKSGAFAPVVMYGADEAIGDCIINGGNVNIKNSTGSLISFQAARGKYSATHKTGDVIIENGANVTMNRTTAGGGNQGRWAILHDENSKVIISDSTVSIFAGYTALKYAPYISGCYEANYSKSSSTDADKLEVWDFEPGHSFGDASCYYFSVNPLGSHNPEADDGNPDTPVLCENCGKVTFAAITKSSVVAGNDLSLLNRVSVADATSAGATQVKIARAFEDGTVKTEYRPLDDMSVITESKVRYYVIPFEGIAAKEIQDEVSVTLCDAAGNALSNTRTDSIFEYAKRMMDGEDEELNTLLADMLHYSAMAQSEFKYRENTPVNQGVSAGTTEMLACSAEKATVNPEAGFTADVYQGTAFILNYNIAMAMRMSAEMGDGSFANVSFTNYKGEQDVQTVYGKALSDGTYAYIYNGLVAADGRFDVTWEFCKADGTKVATVVDSMEQYVGRNVEALPYLAKLMNYSDSAYIYFT